MGGPRTQSTFIRQYLLDIINAKPGITLPNVEKELNKKYALGRGGVNGHLSALIKTKHIVRDMSVCKECGMNWYLYNAKKKEYTQ